MAIHRKQPKTVTSISTPRWLGYATAAAATAALAHAGTAEASVVVVQENLTFDAPSGSPMERAFALGLSGARFTLAQYHTSGGPGGATAMASGGALLRGVRVGRGTVYGGSYGNDYPSKLGPGQAIKPGNFYHQGPLANGFLESNSQWQKPGTGYLGFAFTDAGGAETGWAELTVAGQTGNSFTLDEYAYGTAGESLTAGEVPEPGSLALLALGGAGLLAWRKRRVLSAAKPTRPA